MGYSYEHYIRVVCLGLMWSFPPRPAPEHKEKRPACYSEIEWEKLHDPNIPQPEKDAILEREAQARRRAIERARTAESERG